MEPTPDQFSAVAQLIESEAPPYVELSLSLFGPHGRRLLKKVMFTAFLYNAPAGEWARQELLGLPAFEARWKCWEVFKTTMLLLEQCAPEPLDLYGEHSRSLVGTYGANTWYLIYQADVRVRSEEFERARRRRRA
eukprot:14505001-Alexandrium_andersonii.AAC.1